MTTAEQQAIVGRDLFWRRERCKVTWVGVTRRSGPGGLPVARLVNAFGRVRWAELGELMAEQDAVATRSWAIGQRWTCQLCGALVDYAQSRTKCPCGYVRAESPGD